MLFPPPSGIQNRRVAITGAGIITALGAGWKMNAEGFREGKTAFRKVTLFNVEKNRVKNAAEVDVPTLPPTKLSSRQESSMDRAGKMLLIATHEAWQQSGWTTSENLPLVLGTTGGGMAQGEEFFKVATKQKQGNRSQARRVVHYQPQKQANDLAMAFDFSGPQTIIANACASGSNAIGHAFDLIRQGYADRALVGGYDSVAQLIFCGFDSLQALSPTSCRPFDANRDGLGLGEGAGMLCLESWDSAKKRGATILGEVTGYGSIIDLHHLTQPHPEGDAAYNSMLRACEMARLNPGDIDYINAHGTATPLNDAAELKAINRLAGNSAGDIEVSSTKASIGHLLGGAGAVEAVISIMVLQEQFLPPMPAVQNPDPGCGFKLVTSPRDKKILNIISNSFGFGGANATLAFRKSA